MPIGLLEWIAKISGLSRSQLGEDEVILYSILYEQSKDIKAIVKKTECVPGLQKQVWALWGLVLGVISVLGFLIKMHMV